MSDGACLVIGGCGFIGRHLLPRIAQTGRELTVLGRRSSPPVALPRRASYVAGDFSDLTLIRRLLAGHDSVIHLAYATVPNTSFDNPLGDLLENLPAAVQLFQEVAAQCRRLVLLSSGGTVYGEALQLPIDESHPTRPISPYGVTKLTLERYAYLYAVTHGLKVTCLRPSNAYGDGQAPFAGQGFVATALAAAMRGEPVQIFGPYGAIRDYIYVGDLADAIVDVLGSDHAGETYNVGSGIGRSNLDVVAAMKPLLAEIGCNVHVVHRPERVFDVHANVLDCTRLFQRVGWRARTGFEAGLQRTRDWLRRQNLG